MQENPKISVIIPVYNAEVYLHRCVDSVLSQNFKDFEVLLIDDGSTDRSANICDEYANLDERVKVFHKKNGGVSSARNIGLDNAAGEWVTFVDSDDWIYNDILDLVPSYSEDLLIFNYKIESYNDLYPSPKIEQASLKQMLEKYVNYEIFRTPWGKFYKRDIISNLRFDTDVKVGEDTLFVLQYLRVCSSIKYCNIYYYVWHRSEAAPSDKYRLCVDKAVDIVSKLYNAYKDLEIRSTDFERFIYDFYLWLCSEDLVNNATIWYRNYTISIIWKDIKYLYSIKNRFFFILKKYRIFIVLYKLYVSLKNKVLQSNI